MPLSRRHLLLFGPVCAWVPSASAQVRDLNDAINKAGRQRMLSQRMAKAYLAIGQGVRVDQAGQVLSDSMALFDRQAVELKAFAPTPEIRAVYERLERQWSDYKTALVGAQPRRAAGGQVLMASARVLDLAQQGTVALEQVSGRPVGRLVNLSGRQRMLSQRMAAMYFSASWGLQPDNAVASLEQSRNEFTQALAQLKAAAESTAAIRTELELAEQQFTFFDSALRTLRAGAVNPRAQADVFTSSERILQLMDAVTGQYARLT